MGTYIHQLQDWPQFRWDPEALAGPLGEVRHRQGRLLGRMESLGFMLQKEAELETLTLEAQGRRRVESQGIPPGHLPPPGECRVWYYGTPPGQQPSPTDCRTAEAIARRDPSARVVYGDDRDGRYSEREGRRTGRAIPRGYPDESYPPYPGRTPYPQREPYPDDRRYPSGRYDHAHPGWESGYRDGLEKGREDASRNRRYEPNRHSWYRAGTRGYDRDYGSKDEYVNIYREGFTRGYAEGFRYR